jgi:hypothetical protein
MLDSSPTHCVGACDSYELLGVKDEFIGGELFDVS